MFLLCFLFFHDFFLRNFEESFGLGQDASLSFLSVQLSVVVFCRLPSVVLMIHFLSKRLAAASRHAPLAVFFFSSSANQRAGNDIPSPFLYS